MHYCDSLFHKISFVKKKRDKLEVFKEVFLFNINKGIDLFE